MNQSSPRSPLRLIHAPETIERSSGYQYWSQQTTDALVDSLRPGSSDSLIVRLDGTVLDGNTRVYILLQRGYDVEALPRDDVPPF